MRGAMVVAGGVGLVVAMLVGVAACGVFVPAPEPSSAYTVSVAPGLHPRMAAADAVSVTHGYLDEQTPELAVPDMHVPANVTHVWAVTATDARTLDPCIPVENSEAIVWVTMGAGDYLNLRSHSWSSNYSQAAAADPAQRACLGPSHEGTMVVRRRDRRDPWRLPRESRRFCPNRHGRARVDGAARPAGGSTPLAPTTACSDGPSSAEAQSLTSSAPRRRTATRPKER